MKRAVLVPQRLLADPHGISETLCLGRHSDSSQRADCPDRHADRHRQSAYAHAIYAAECRDRQSRGSREARPTNRPKWDRRRMARGGEDRGQKCEGGSCPGCAAQIRHVMSRARNQSLPAACPCGPRAVRPTSRTEMNSRLQSRCQPCVAGHHQDEAAAPADPSEVATQRLPARLAVMAQHNTSQTAGQPPRCWSRIRQPPRVGEEPKSRDALKGAAARDRRMSPGNEPCVHVLAYRAALGGFGAAMTARRIADS
jgi:hypothetical protein